MKQANKREMFTRRNYVELVPISVDRSENRCVGVARQKQQ